MTDVASVPRFRTAHEITDAVRAVDLPLVMWEIPSGRVFLTSRSAAHALGLRPEQVLGRRLQEFTHRGGDVFRRIVGALESGAVDAVRTRTALGTGGLKVPDGEAEAWIWSRSITVGGRRLCVSLVIPQEEEGRLGRCGGDERADALADTAVGVMTAEWLIESACAEMTTLTGLPMSALVGRPLSDILEFDAAATMSRRRGVPDVPVHALLHRADGATLPAGFLYAPVPADPEGRLVFAVLAGGRGAAAETNRILDLENRLRRIGAEVRAAGVLDQIGFLPAVVRSPALGDLSLRQWEVLSRLLRGERVPSIAAHLYLSPSTVRNHLSAIYRKFGVHTQAELLAQLLPPLSSRGTKASHASPRPSPRDLQQR